ncbi:glycosyltransferase family 2 protein [Oscillatoria acuminata]|uniref:Putative glycosyltransferase n=1 Tax=Oscillatoria acuminata PCC 6304 TaxID=56110 RepID=K9TJG4_9CYAN|nr:glycosyltransferase family 2 protein [Oscillatoria acuminata]AFY82266.1 putative glycosyltransferase [Oscillatoria acuminata PCC 6304]
MERQTIAVIMTCYNRREKTLNSLAGLFRQKLPPEVILTIYLVDDGSTDGTSEGVQEQYPNVKLIKGTGSLFWNGGMRRAFSEAIASDPDFYLWLNDDTILYPDAIAKALSTYQSLQEREELLSVIVGSTCDPHTDTLTYGGMVQKNWWHPLKFQLLQPNEEPQRCDTMNGNFVLIPREIAKRVGNLDPNFVHSIGDVDYGLRVKQNGGLVWVVPGYVGTCPVNSLAGDCWADTTLKAWERVKQVNQPKGLPVGEWKVFARRHAGPFWPVYWFLPYLRLVLAAILGGKMSSNING